MQLRAPLSIACLFYVACGSSTMDNPPPPSAGFSPKPVAEGFTRFVLPTIPAIGSGSDVQKCQYIAGPSDSDRYVTIVDGQQSKGGHHIVLYANQKSEPVGTSRDCTGDDTLSIAFLGAYGGEGNSTGAAPVPEGVAFKLPKGQALMTSTHFINASQEAVDGQSVLDVKYVDVATVKQVANNFANLSVAFKIPAGQTASLDVSCKFTKDLSFFRMANHLHEWGKSAYTEVIRADGKRELLTRNDTWQKEMTFNFPFATWPLDKLLVIKKGDTVVTHCAWTNTTTRDLTFPDEMCVVFGFYIPGDGPQVSCVDNNWDGGPP